LVQELGDLRSDVLPCKRSVMGSAAAHEVTEHTTVEAEGDSMTAADKMWAAALDAVEAAIVATASCGDSCSSTSSGADEPMAEVLWNFCEDAIDGVPLPKPWSWQQDALGRVCFQDDSTGVSQLDHPLSTVLVELCALCRAYFRLPLHLRSDLLTAARRHWESESKREYSMWHAVEHESGSTYYYHEESGQSTWHHPRGIVLPQYYMRLRAVARLGKEAYVDKLSIEMMNVRIGCSMDMAVHPEEDCHALHHRANTRQFHFQQLQHANKHVVAQSCSSAAARVHRTSFAEMYSGRSCSSMVAAQEQLQHFDLAAGDDVLEAEDCAAMLAPPDPLSRWYEVY